MDETGKGALENSSFQNPSRLAKYKQNILRLSPAFRVGLGLVYPKFQNSQKFSTLLIQIPW